MLVVELGSSRRSSGGWSRWPSPPGGHFDAVGQLLVLAVGLHLSGDEVVTGLDLWAKRIEMSVSVASGLLSSSPRAAHWLLRHWDSESVAGRRVQLVRRGA
eukprot:14291901-Heterocapsa_arctica.AAC.1